MREQRVITVQNVNELLDNSGYTVKLVGFRFRIDMFVSDTVSAMDSMGNTISIHSIPDNVRMDIEYGGDPGYMYIDTTPPFGYKYRDGDTIDIWRPLEVCDCGAKHTSLPSDHSQWCSIREFPLDEGEDYEYVI